jgi:hypothetical protein
MAEVILQNAVKEGQALLVDFDEEKQGIVIKVQ